MKAFKAILIKEFRHIFRDMRTLVLVISMPVVLVILFGYTIRNEITNTKIAVLDYSKDTYSKLLIEKMTASTYFEVQRTLSSESEIQQAFQQGLINMAIIIPRYFEENIVRRKEADLQLIIDASNINIATTIESYGKQIVNDFQKDLNEHIPNYQPFDVSIKMQYNPTLESAYMFIPGNIALIMILITTLMTSITLSREKETGSWRMLAITPVKQLWMVVAKIIPYMIISLICTVMVILLGIFMFKMPMNGSITLLVLVCIMFMFTACALGILISVVTQSQQVAMLLCMLGLFLPTLLLSGFIFPLENMPVVLQLTAHIIPSKWFIIALKDIMIKGSGLTAIWLPISILSIMTIGLIGVSVKKLMAKTT
ncbi:MAG: ABC transporter permease [Bacteroidales bacterium]|nr:ABC transporter permease [Bacteroidales bacterium]